MHIVCVTNHHIPAPRPSPSTPDIFSLALLISIPKISGPTRKTLMLPNPLGFLLTVPNDLFAIYTLHRLSVVSSPDPVSQLERSFHSGNQRMQLTGGIRCFNLFHRPGLAYPNSSDFAEAHQQLVCAFGERVLVLGSQGKAQDILSRTHARRY